MQKSDLWRRWKAGQSLHEIGRAFGKSHSSIRCVVSHHGGIVPRVRRRSLLALTLPEREDISRGIASGSSIRKIAQLLDRAASTVSREVVRHGGRPEYRAQEADAQSSGRRCRARVMSGSEPSRVRTEFRLRLPEPINKSLLKSRGPTLLCNQVTPCAETMRFQPDTINPWADRYSGIYSGQFTRVSLPGECAHSGQAAERCNELETRSERTILSITLSGSTR